jgi:hypothetical protein
VYNTKVDYINKKLENLYGKTLDGKPRFRVVWSDEQFEFRKGEFNEYSGPIFIRTVKGVKRVPKYSYIKERWVFEMYCEGSAVNVPDLVAETSTYEPMYVFQSGKGEYLEPLLKVCQAFVFNYLHPECNPDQRRAYYEEIEIREFDNEVKYFENTLDTPYLADRLHDNDGIIINPGFPKGGN